MTSDRKSCDAMPWLQEAWRLFGVQEKAGRNDHADIMALYRDVGHPGIAHDETPWCAAFAGACLERSGIKSTRSLLARSFSTWGVALDTPRMGSIVVLSRGSDPVYGHVGFWLGETAKRIFLLGGNQSNRVSVAAFDKRRLVAVRWPEDPGNDAHEVTQSSDTNTSQTRAQFDLCLPHILKMEGGYTHDPYDPGGPTNFGITLKVLAAWRKERLTETTRRSLIADLKQISPDEVRAIYHKNYWQRADCDAFLPGLALMHFDCAVNQGVSRAIRFLQSAVDTDVDGEIGPLTLAAARRMDERDAITRYAYRRRSHYRSLHHFWRFGRGWMNRVAATERLALARAAEMTATLSDEHDPAAAQTNPTQTQITIDQKETDMATKPATPELPKWWGHSMTIWGVVITTLSTVLPTLGPVIGVDVTPDLVKDAGEQLVTTVQAISGLLGTLMTIYGRARAKQPLAQRAISVTI